MEPGQRDDDVFNNPVSKIIVVGVSSKVLEGEHGDGWQQFFAGSGRHADAAGFDFESVSLYRFLEILELEIAEIANLIADRTTHQIVDCFGQDDSLPLATWLLMAAVYAALASAAPCHCTAWPSASRSSAMGRWMARSNRRSALSKTARHGEPDRSAREVPAFGEHRRPLDGGR